MFIDGLKLDSLTWMLVETDSFLEAALSGHSQTGTYKHFPAFIFQHSWLKVLRSMNGFSLKPSCTLLWAH